MKGFTLENNATTRNKKMNNRLRNLLKEDMSATAVLRVSVAEIIGTAILMFIGCLGCLGSLNSGPLPIWHGNFAFGFAVLIAIQGVGHISSAHINPAITLGSVVLGLKSLPIALVYIVSQIVGAMIGFGLLHVVTPMHLLHGGDPNKTAEFCVTQIHEDISVIQGILIEILATGILMFAVSALWDKRNEINSDSAPLRVALVVFVLCEVVAPFTGCSMNPARSLAPAIWNNHWTNHWVFWVGPLVGSLVSSLLYKVIFWPSKSEQSETTGNVNDV